MRWLLVLSPCLTSGCILFPCGGADISGTTATNYAGEVYDGHWSESCGLADTSGTWNLFGDGLAWIDFGFSGHGGFQGIDIEVAAAFPTELLVPGASLTTDEVSGSAHLNPGITLSYDAVGLTEGTIEVVSGWEGEDPCAELDGPTFRLKWDLVYGGDGPTYVLQGNDKVQFSTFLSQDCGGWY